MGTRARCEVCRKTRDDCLKTGKYLICSKCVGIYNEVRTIVLEAVGVAV